MRQGGSNSKGSRERCLPSAELLQRSVFIFFKTANADPLAAAMKCKAKRMTCAQRGRG
jgi:hypothetical protein